MRIGKKYILSIFLDKSYLHHEDVGRKIQLTFDRISTEHLVENLMRILPNDRIYYLRTKYPSAIKDAIKTEPCPY